MSGTDPQDPGQAHLDWILRFQWILLPIGALAWLLRSRRAALAFLAGGAGSLLFWGLHRFLTARMLTPSLRRRWFYATLTLGKLALIALLLRGMMDVMPDEGLPLATGVLLFVAGILLEAIRLAAGGSEAPPPEGN